MSYVALIKCFFCLEGNELLLHRQLRDISRFNGKVMNMDPCDKCKGYMQQGVILITIDDEKSGKDWHKPPADWNNARRGVGAEKKQWMPNPHRTGGWFVLRDEAIKRMIHPDEMANYALRNRWMFIEHVAGELMGLFGDEVRRKAEERIEFTL